MRNPDKAPLGGWLIIFIAMYTISAAQSLLGLWPSFQIAAQMPSHAALFLGAAGVIAVWNVFILYCMVRLITRKPDAIRLSKLMLISGPVIAAITPLMGLVMVLATVPEATFNGQLFAQTYNPEVMGQLTGMVLLTLVWYRFLCASKRVAAIWGPEGELAQRSRSKEFFDAIHERPAFDIEPVEEDKPEGK
jgi:hypothetical protein